jgi:ATP-dependent Clp protease ATP-binding subunit ClpB
MSEYMEKHTVARLLGAPPGYVGYEEGGQLSEAVRRRPYAVVLFDEIEKAHHDVLNVLLQVLDDGRLTDGHGKTVDFKNTVIIMTSNVGSDLLQDFFQQGRGSRAGWDRLENRVRAELKNHFRPEFLNRVDDIIVFHSLEAEHLAAIVDIQLRLVERRLGEQHLTLTVDRAARQLLAQEGYDPQFGARPLKRVIQVKLLDPLAAKLLAGEFKPGDRILVTGREADLVFSRA